MIEFRHLQAFAAVVEQQGFEKAAERLAITQSAVSQRVRNLETQVGHKLLVRSNPPTLTTKGEFVLSHYQQVAHLQHDLSVQLSGDDQEWQRIAIGTNADSLATWLLDALDPLLKRHKLLLDLQIDDQDRTHELLRRGEVLGCISSSPDAIAGCNCVPLGSMVYRCLVSAHYRELYFPDGVTVEALKRAPCVEFNAKDDLQRSYLKQHFQCSYDIPKNRIPSTESYLDFIVRGWAWGMVPDMQSEHLRASGRVEELIPGYTVETPLYWHIWNLRTQLHRDLTDQLCRRATEILQPIAD